MSFSLPSASSTRLGQLVLALFFVGLLGCNNTQPVTAEATLSFGDRWQDDNMWDGIVDTRSMEPRILTELNALRSQSMLDGMLETDSVQATDWYQSHGGDIDAARRDARDHVLSATHLAQTTLVRLSATTGNAEDSLMILTKWIEVYLREVERRAESRYLQDRIAFQRQYEDVIQQLETLESRINRHLLDHPQSAMTSRNDAATQELLFINAKRSEIVELLAAARASYALLQQRLESSDIAPSDDEVRIIESSTAIQRFDARIREHQVAREAQVDNGRLESHPAIVNMDSQIRNLEKERDDAFDNQARSLFDAKFELGGQAVAVYQEQLRIFDPRIAELQAQIENIQRAMAQYQTMLRNQEGMELQRDFAQAKLRELAVLLRRSNAIGVEVASPPAIVEP